ncbi:hypothetical protein IAR55_000491 [Kwoniella newhampshirensis]|uniref:Rho guanyl-nucleotide exchange factor n=1 Tax=Kwoniella newhampshirensis TaxID=1651941 RepID=A0AAW0Z6X9_9TREE
MSTVSHAGPSRSEQNLHIASDALANRDTGAGPSSSGSKHLSSSPPSKPRGFRKWSMKVAGRRKARGRSSDKGVTSIEEDSGPRLPTEPYEGTDATGRGVGETPYTDGRIRVQDFHEDTRQEGVLMEHDLDRLRMEEGYEWEEESEDEVRGVAPDAYSWVDPSFLGTAELGATPTGSSSQVNLQNRSGGSSRRRSFEEVELPSPPDLEQTPKYLHPDDSYNLLLAYQATSESDHSHMYSSYLPTPADSGNIRNPNPEWYEMVDRSLSASLPKEEQNRQGLWWEMIKGEREYVRDMKIVCDVFIQPLRDCDPPLLTPPAKLHAFIAEVFSTAQLIYHAHLKLLGRLMERQRHEWPLMTTATDILLSTFLEIAELYEAYMKNYPFAEARVRREASRNAPFRGFLNDRNSVELTKRRDISVFLSRPVTRLPRILLILEALHKVTPPDHPDREDLPTAIEILQGVVKGTQPGIESAEAKIKLWNVAEKLLFKKGEIIELDIADPKRTLVHMGYVFRRVRSETNWHGWQDLHAILLDNYFLLTRDEEHGKHVVVSRPIHLDFLNLVAADGVPERRYDFVSRYSRRQIGHMEPSLKPERLMFPFTVTSSGGVNGRTYTLCTAEEWREKIEGAKSLRKFDVDSNRIMAVHTISIPSGIKEGLTGADAFTWHNRETVAVATPRSIWLGWRRDLRAFGELIRFNAGHISMVSIIPDFGWLLILSSGTLLAYNLRELMPTSEPSTWLRKSRSDASVLSAADHVVAFVRIGVTKGRLLVVYAVHSRNTHHTSLHFYEPLISSYDLSANPFRMFGSVTIPGYASELSFFRQTIAVVTEKSFVIAEPGNPTYNAIPTFSADITPTAMVVRMVATAKPLGMYQVGENDFLLVYDWGACFVTKFGEISRNGALFRWNLTPAYAVFRPPYILLFDEIGGRAEVRDVNSGKVCEVVEEKGLRMFHLTRIDQGLVGRCNSGLIQLVEVSASKCHPERRTTGQELRRRGRTPLLAVY